MGKDVAPQVVILDLHVRDLKGHSDDEGKVEKVPVVGLDSARKNQTARRLILVGRIGVPIISMSIISANMVFIKNQDSKIVAAASTTRKPARPGGRSLMP